jgi:NTP pyrophosphatase (non-canonical NTP hydrolase)
MGPAGGKRVGSNFEVTQPWIVRLGLLLPSATEKNKMNSPDSNDVSIKQFQDLIRKMYFEKDQARGIPGTFMWLAEEIGELSSALRETEHLAEQLKLSPAADTQTKHDAVKSNLEQEFADVFAWLATIANVAGVDLSAALFNKYGAGCPGCGNFICDCPDAEKP